MREHPRVARAAAVVAAGYVEASGRSSGGSNGELGASDSGGADSGCDTADALATADNAGETTSQPPQAMHRQPTDGAEP